MLSRSQKARLGQQEKHDGAWVAKMKPQQAKHRKVARNDSEWRAICILAYGEWCRVCGTSREIQMDHVWPRAQGGPSVVENGLPLCREHHEAKTAGTLKFRFGWFTQEQVAWLAKVGWVWWDETGEPCGRGFKHFAAKAAA